MIDEEHNFREGQNILENTVLYSGKLREKILKYGLNER